MNDDTKALATTTQAITPAQFKHSFNDLVKFTKSELKIDKDFGVIPGTQKKSLYKAGAEKIAFLFGLKPEVELMDKVEDWDKGFFSYRYKATLIHFATGKPAGSAERTCNSKEKKYAYTTKAEKWATDEEKARMVSKKKNEKYGSWDLIIRKSPDEAADQVNTIMAMAQKRAIVAAVVQSTMASEIFDADVSESDEEAPNKSVTKQEDPRRSRITMGLYGIAIRHGWDDEWIHRAIKKKWDVDSLTNCSNEQIETLKEFIEEKYEEVGKGEKPKLKEATPKPAEALLPDPNIQGDLMDQAKEAEIVGDPEDYRAKCANCKTKYLPEDVQDLEPEKAIHYCSKRCFEEYYPPKEEKTYPWEKKDKTSTTS